jgi:hypothetical protein
MREGKESGVATGAHRRGRGRGRTGDWDLAQCRAAGDLSSDSSPRREEGDGPAGLHGRLGQAGFGWAVRVWEKGRGCWGRLGFQPGFGPVPDRN